MLQQLCTVHSTLEIAGSSISPSMSIMNENILNTPSDAEKTKKNKGDNNDSNQYDQVG